MWICNIHDFLHIDYICPLCSSLFNVFTKLVLRHLLLRHGLKNHQIQSGNDNGIHKVTTLVIQFFVWLMWTWKVIKVNKWTSYGIVAKLHVFVNNKWVLTSDPSDHPYNHRLRWQDPADVDGTVIISRFCSAGDLLLRPASCESNTL